MRETTLMKLRLNKLAVSFVALSALAAWATPASAGDWNNGDGSLKESRGRAAVAVPAPMPVPENGPGWYLRGSLGYSLKQTGDLISSGYDVGLYRSFDELGGSPSLGAGFGAYINNNVRWDLTGDLRPTQRISRQSVSNYKASVIVPNSGTINVVQGQVDPRTGAPIIIASTGLQATVSLAAPTSTFHNYDVGRSEEARTGNQTFLANMYYEPISRGMFKPYIGAGAGFAINTIKRTYSETGVCTGSDTKWVDPFYETITTRHEVGCLAAATTTSASGTASETGFGLAGALMAGIGYEVKDGVTLDLGYRYLWQAGSVAALSAAGPAGGINKVEIGDRTDHEIRTSLRWAIK
jgi:opacity protein-like surface antigen